MGASASELAKFEDEGPAVTEERILRILKKIEGTNDVLVEEIMDKKGSEKGDGFMSDISDVKVEATVQGNTKEYQWMIKHTPRDPNRWVMSRLWFKADEREVKFFSDLLPRLKTFAESKNKSNLIPSFCPAPFAEWNEVDKVLVMQNLRPLGYRDAVNKKAGLNIDHVTLVIKWLAAFHALGYAYVDQYIGGIEKMQTEELEINFWKFWDIPNFEKLMAQFKDLNIQTQLGLMKQIDEMVGNNDTYYVGTYQKFLDKHGCLDTVAIDIRDSWDTSKFKIKTFNHGDPWFNNMLFKYNSKDESSMVPIDVKLIDLQEVGYLPPTMDLTYFLFSSTTGEIRNNLSQLLRLYHDEFITIVNQLGSVLSYTYEELVADFKESAFYGLHFALGPLAQVLAEKEDILDMDDFSKKFGGRDMMSDEVKADMQKEMDHLQQTMKKNINYQVRIRELIDELVAMGVM